ncbi:MAG TPA: glycosyltransferase family 39 protein, partial [Anaerolineae bacterium]|nr:glycosyltransferase family 39 protein [Anaerolineae bacterium]
MAEEMRSESGGWDREDASQVTWRSVWEFLRQAGGSLRGTTSSPGFARLAMVAILLLASVLRFTGLDWDEHQHLHPDERFLTMVENSLDWPKSLGEYFDTAINPLNPYNRGHGAYVYGLFPLAMAKFVGQVVGKTGYDGVYLVGRALSAIADMLSIVLVFLIGRRLYDSRVGLVGALLLSLSVLDIQQSHYFTVDTYATLFVTLALYLAVRIAQGEGLGSVLMLGVAFGLAVASKISVLSFLLVIGLAYALRTVARWKQSRVESSRALVDLHGRWGRARVSFRVESDRACPPLSHTDRLLLQGFRAAGSILLVLLVAFVVFRVAQPQAFTGPGFFGLKLNDRWKDDMDYVRKLVSGQIDYPPSHQWTARLPVWYCMKNMVLWGLGPPLGLAVWASWALAGYQLVRRQMWQHLLVWVWMSFTFGYQSIQFVKPVRYLLPIYPTMAVIAGYGLVWLWDRATRLVRDGPADRWRRWVRPAATMVIAMVVLGTAAWAFAFTSIYTRPLTRVAASRWMYQNIPRGSSTSFEMWDDPLPLNIDGHIGGDEYNVVHMEPYWEDTPEKREKLLSWLDEIEYIVLSSNRLYGSIPRLPTRFPVTTRYYEALFSGELGYDHLVTFTSRPRLFGVEIADDDADESFTVYDHPKV